MPLGIHPGLTLLLLLNMLPNQPFADWRAKTIFTFAFSIFAEHAVASCASVNFEVTG
jgi:hypothetical protein